MKNCTFSKLEFIRRLGGSIHNVYIEQRTSIERIFLKSETKRQNNIILKWAEDLNQTVHKRKYTNQAHENSAHINESHSEIAGQFQENG